MTRCQRLASVLSAAVFVTGITFAATTTPPPTTTPLPADTPAASTPTLLWVYGDPTPQWLTKGYFGTDDACAASLTTMHPSQGQAAECFPVGVDPARLHEKYTTDTEAPLATK